MENSGWSWGKTFLENSKILGNKIISGVKDASIYVAEKSKEGANYIAEKTKPATDKIKEGASYIGTYTKNTYNNVKSKITGEKIENNNNDEELNMNDNNNDKNMPNPLIGGESKYSEI